ncbi:MAG: CPBP family intramembrane metalloprotease, partial [Chloroflexi bacterium]
IVLLSLLGLYLAFASDSFVAALRRFADSRHHKLLLVLILVIPVLLLLLPEAAANRGAFLGRVGRFLLYLLVPTVALLGRPRGAKALHWLDVVAILAIWLPVEFDWLPDVRARLAEGVSLPVSLLTAVCLAFMLFLVIRPLPRVGFTFRLGRKDGRFIGTSLLAYTIVGIPLGLVTRFLIWQPAPFNWSDWVLAWPLGYLFTALPEELLFRGVIQHQLVDRVGRPLGLLLASIIFGLAHLNNATPGYPVPNQMYVLMATLAGLAYGWTWQKTGKITASAVVHATVNYIWGILLGG